MDEEALRSPLRADTFRTGRKHRKTSDLKRLLKVPLTLVTMYNVLSGVAVYEFGTR